MNVVSVLIGCVLSILPVLIVCVLSMLWTQMLEMVLHFELVSSWTTENDLVAMFRLSHEAEPDSGLVYTQFIEFVCRLCSHGGRSEASVETKINSVLSRLDANPACIQIRRPISLSQSQSGRAIRNGSPRAATPAQVKTPRAKTPRGRNSRGGMVEYDEVVDEVNTSRLRNNEEVLSSSDPVAL